MNEKCVKVSTVVGSFLLLISAGLPWQWGNLSVYALSYTVYRHPSASSVQEPWVISTFLISQIVTLICSNSVARLLKRRTLILLAILISNMATFMSYFTIQHSMALLTVTFGCINGLSMGILYGNAIYLVMKCADKDVGTLCSILLASFPSGAIIITQLVTWYCNPYNKTPDFKLGRSVYFTQIDVLEKVPSVFLVLGSFSLAAHAIGFILLQSTPEMKCNLCWGSDKSESQPMTDAYQLQKEDQRIPNGELPGTSKDLTPKEVLRSITFYILWLSLFMNDFPYIVLTNYYKLFGQVWIHDDVFLTNLGTAMLISTFIIRIAWGVAIDRLGVKCSFMCLFGSLSVLSSWYYFTARVNRWLYFLANLLYGGICSSIFSCYMTATAALFGKTNVSTHYGMLMTASLVFNCIAPVLLKTILVHFGWFFTFACGGIVNALNLILCLIFIGHD